MIETSVKYKVHWRTHPNGFTCCGPGRNGLDSTPDKAMVTCIKGQYAAGLIPSPYTGPKTKPRRGWAQRITDSIERSYNNNRPMDQTAVNILAMLKGAGWMAPKRILPTKPDFLPGDSRSPGPDFRIKPQLVMCRKCFRASSMTSWNGSNTRADDRCHVCATDSDVLGAVRP